MSEPGNSSVLFARVPAVGNRKALRAFSQRLSREVAGGRRFTCLITRDAELRRMNSAFLGKDEPTDVLSFPASEDPTGWLGEIAISADRAQAQAREHGHTTESEIRLLMLHGVLHLVGMNHVGDRGKMRRAEMRWRKALGLPTGLIERSSQGRRR
jgi:probable rRNA maturation factor